MVGSLGAVFDRVLANPCTTRSIECILSSLSASISGLSGCGVSCIDAVGGTDIPRILSSMFGSLGSTRTTVLRGPCDGLSGADPAELQGPFRPLGGFGSARLGGISDSTGGRGGRGDGFWATCCATCCATGRTECGLRGPCGSLSGRKPTRRRGCGYSLRGVSTTETGSIGNGYGSVTCGGSRAGSAKDCCCRI